MWDGPASELIRRRFSCRTYDPWPLAAETRARLEAGLSELQAGPFGTPVRLVLLAATEEDRQVLRGLSTYGLIRGAMAFIAGAVERGTRDMEDLGFLMEQAVLLATGLELGTCWLGGTLNRSRFASQIALRENESIPCVVAAGYIAGRRGLIDTLVRRAAGSDHRFNWERLFFDSAWSTPITPEAAGPYALPLEMVRLAPSASNKQPWRVVRKGGKWHFYLRRTPGYKSTELDLQRVDMGIAFCHWALAAREAELAGQWAIEPPALPLPDERTEYVATWG